MKKYLYLLATDKNNGILAKLFKCILYFISCIYSFIVRVVSFCYIKDLFKRYRLDRPVISIGNITMGGVGKTPLVAYIANFMKHKNLKSVILTRGYMGNGFNSVKQISDEAEMLELTTGAQVLVGSNRFKNAKEYLENESCDVFVLDDGFQHWRLKRDIDILVVNAVDPWGNGCLLPRGILREPFFALSRADIFILSKTDYGRSNVEMIKQRIQSWGADKPIFETIHRPVCVVDIRTNESFDLKHLIGKNMFSLSSIGDPDAFELALHDLEYSVQRKFQFMDHHNYSIKDVQSIVSCCQDEKIDAIVTTEKDAVKLNRMMDIFPERITIYYLKIEISFIEGEEKFFERINCILQR